MAELIAAGTTQAASADFTLAAGDQKTVFLKDAAGPRVAADAVAKVQIKSAAGEYFDVGQVDANGPAKMLGAPGTFRVLRLECSAAVGVDLV